MPIENCKMKSANWRVVQAPGRPDSALASHVFAIWNLEFGICNFLYPALAVILLLTVFSSTQAQTVADKTVATVTNGARANPDLITYSDIVWQLALEPGRPFNERPSSPELNQGLKSLEDQLLILEEARKLPLAPTAEAQREFDKTVNDRRNELVQAFGSRMALEERMARVGLTSDQLDAILRDRVTIERYLDFRFRAFVLVSAQEISARYEKKYGPFRNTDRLVPTLEQAHDNIERELTEEKIAEAIGKFVDNLREQPGTEIIVLNPV